MEIAWNSSPDAGLDGWKSPVLLIQGDDDRNVPFQQTVDLARRLEERNLSFEELVLPMRFMAFCAMHPGCAPMKPRRTSYRAL